MKKHILIVAALLLISGIFAQSADAYLEKITKEAENINIDTWDYIGAVAREKNARKEENSRKDILKSNMSVQHKIEKMEDFKGSSRLKESVLVFLKQSYDVINNDYKKIVEMEEAAEKSYDAMEAYLTAQQQACKKLKDASVIMVKEEKEFALSHNVNLASLKSKNPTRPEEAANVFSYYNKMYLIFFKSSKQEAAIQDALNKNDATQAKMSIDALKNSTEEGLKYLDTAKPYKSDNTIRMACKHLLSFYKIEAVVKAPVIINYANNKENFYKVKTEFEAKPQKGRLEKEINEYNKAADDMNKATIEYDKVNNDLGLKRLELIKKWDETIAAFFDAQLPKYK